MVDPGQQQLGNLPGQQGGLMAWEAVPPSSVGGDPRFPREQRFGVYHHAYRAGFSVWILDGLVTGLSPDGEAGNR